MMFRTWEIQHYFGTLKEAQENVKEYHGCIITRAKENTDEISKKK